MHLLQIYRIDLIKFFIFKNFSELLMNSVFLTKLTKIKLN